MNLQLVEQDLGKTSSRSAWKRGAGAQPALRRPGSQWNWGGNGASSHGTVRLGCIPTIAPSCFAGKLLQVCGKAYPDLELLLREGTTTCHRRQLEQGRLDLLIWRCRWRSAALLKTVGRDPSTW